MQSQNKVPFEMAVVDVTESPMEDLVMLVEYLSNDKNHNNLRSISKALDGGANCIWNKGNHGAVGTLQALTPVPQYSFFIKGKCPNRDVLVNDVTREMLEEALLFVELMGGSHGR